MSRSRREKASQSSPRDLCALRPVLLLLVGASGSGKTVFYNTHLKAALPKVLKASASPLDQGETDEERRRLLRAREFFVYQSVVFDLALIQEAKSEGYEVKGVYVSTEDPDLNLARVILRVNNGGGFAPVSRIPQDCAYGVRQLPEVKKRVDDLMLFDNTPHGRGVRLIAYFRERELVRLARPIPGWAQRAFGQEFGTSASATAKSLKTTICDYSQS